MKFEMSFKQNGGSSAAIYVVRFSFPLSLHPLRETETVWQHQFSLRQTDTINMLHSS